MLAYTEVRTKKPQCSSKRNKRTLLIHWHQRTAAPVHMCTCTINCRTTTILLMQTQRPVVYTPKKQLQSINTLAHIDGHTQANARMDAHIRRVILQLLGSRGTECPRQLWIPLNVRMGAGDKKAREIGGGPGWTFSHYDPPVIDQR